MNHIKRLFFVGLAVLFASAASAREGERIIGYPQVFVGLQAGGQTTLTDYDNCKLMTPTASVSIGSFFTQNIGARLHFNGIWNKGGLPCSETEDFKYRYKYLTSDIDLLVNLVSLIGKKRYYPLNVYLIGGIGLNYAWGNKQASGRKDLTKDVLSLAYDGGSFSHNARIGTQIDYSVSKHVGLNLEVAANCLKDAFNSKLSKKGDWQLTAQVGVSYKFSAKKKSREKAEKQTQEEVPMAEVWENRVDTVWYDVPSAVAGGQGTVRKFKTKTVHYRVK